MNAKNIPKIKLKITSPVIPDAANSVPPLNPIENNKYKEIKLLEAAGISKSLFTNFASMPSMKKSNVGFVTLKISKSKFIIQ